MEWPIGRVTGGKSGWLFTAGVPKNRAAFLESLWDKGFFDCRNAKLCNHIHLLLEVPPLPTGGLSDGELLQRLRCIYGEAYVAEVAKRLGGHRQSGNEAAARELHEGFTYRMHDLSEFMKGFMQRYTQWHNRSHKRSGGLWEDVFKSVLVEDGVASRTIAAYIDLNPVRAGIVPDPAGYRWSSYGEAMGGGPRGKGKKARAGVVRLTVEPSPSCPRLL